MVLPLWPFLPSKFTRLSAKWVLKLTKYTFVVLLSDLAAWIWSSLVSKLQQAPNCKAANPHNLRPSLNFTFFHWVFLRQMLLFNLRPVLVWNISFHLAQSPDEKGSLEKLKKLFNILFSFHSGKQSKFQSWHCVDGQITSPWLGLKSVPGSFVHFMPQPICNRSNLWTYSDFSFVLI